MFSSLDAAKVLLPRVGDPDGIVPPYQVLQQFPKNGEPFYVREWGGLYQTDDEGIIALIERNDSFPPVSG